MASRAPSHLVSLPSLSSSLHALPHATSMSNVSLHPSMYANRAAESEAKLQQALNKQAASLGAQQPSSPVVPGYSQQPQDAMRKKKFTM
ncbi:hypothetical protein FA13DRAFT_1796745 [Coprinellus micaceus]|uniref:Uncharacterized protein n=1 Tax=Coprinellus micaceus TaxID=71717 RepID=A0A4Y7STU5_COPMI|nr:hypothetical protein FA13DRAFT_1796745 [Coprinellus micaceus]